MLVEGHTASAILPLAEASGADESPHGLTAQTTLARNLSLRNASAKQFHVRFVMDQPTLSVLLDQSPVSSDGFGFAVLVKRLISHLFLIQPNRRQPRSGWRIPMTFHRGGFPFMK